MTTITPDQIKLYRGNHAPPNGKQEGCLLEWASYLAGEPWSDRPECVSPIIAAFGRRWNDDLDDESRQILAPYAAKIINTKGTKAQEERRAWMLTDWMVRTYLPAWLDLANLTDQATQVRGLPELTSAAKWKKASPTMQKVRKDSDAAWAAAWDAAWAAARAAARDAAWAVARDAAWDAAGDAARDAAWDAAWAAARAAARDVAWAAARAAARDAAWAVARAAARDAARDAAWDAAGAAAWAAAWAALKPTVTSLQASALNLLDRLIEVTTPVPS